MDKFEIGEIAIYIKPGSPHYGKEVIIMGNLQFVERLKDYQTNEIFGDYAYKVDKSPFPEIESLYAYIRPKYLRKKRPPRTNPDVEETKEKGCGDWPFLKELLFTKEKEKINE